MGSSLFVLLGIVPILNLHVVTGTFAPRVYRKEASFIDAIETCYTNGNDWGLPIVYSSALEETLRFAYLKSAWLGMQKVIYEHWQWIDGSNYTFQKEINETQNCGAIQNDGLISAIDCSSENTNYICEFNYHGYRKCPMRHMCMHINQSMVAVGCHAGSWVMAKNFCRRMDGNLIILQPDNKLKKVIENLLAINCAKSNHLFFIGLSREDWFPLIDTSSIVAKQGPISSRKYCAVVFLNQRGHLDVIERNCLSKSPFICVQYISSPQTTDLTTTGNRRSGKKEIKKDAVKTGLIAATAIFGTAFVVFFAVVIRLFTNAKAHHRRKVTDPANEGQRLVPLPSEAELLAEAICIRNDVLKNNAPGKEDINILLVGLPGVGKSSLVNSLITALTPGGYQTLAKPGNFGKGGMAITWFMEPFPLFESSQSVTGEIFKCKPVLWDCPGFVDDSSVVIVNILRQMIRGEFPLNTSNADIKHLTESIQPNNNELKEGDYNKLLLSEYYPPVKNKSGSATCSQVDLLLFVHDCQTAVPEQLAEAVSIAVRENNNRSTPVVLVINKIDKLLKTNNMSDEISDKTTSEGKAQERLKKMTEKMSKAIGLFKQVDRISQLSCYFADDEQVEILRSPEIDMYMCALWKQILNKNHYRSYWQ